MVFCETLTDNNACYNDQGDHLLGPFSALIPIVQKDDFPLFFGSVGICLKHYIKCNL